MKTIAGLMIAALAAAASQAMARGTVYVPTGSAGEVLVIDADRDSVVGTIPGVKDVHGLAAAPGSGFLVGGMYAEIAPHDATLPPKPEGMPEEVHRAHHAAPAGTTAMGEGSVSFLSIIATDSKSVVRRVEVPGAVHHTAVTPDGRYALSTHPNGGGISVVDLSSFKVAGTVETGPLPNYVVVSGDGTRVYVSNAGNDTISEIDTDGWVVRRNFPVGSSPGHIVLSSDGGTLYVANADDGTVSAISLPRGEVAATYTVGGTLHGIDTSDDGHTLFVSARERDALVAIDLRDGDMRTVPLAPSPYHLTAVRGTGKLYVSSADEPKIWVLDQRSLEVLGEIPIRGKGHQMAVVQR